MAIIYLTYLLKSVLQKPSKNSRIKSISRNYKSSSRSNLFSKEERKDIISRYTLREDYNCRLNLKKELAEEYVGEDEDTDGTEVIESLLKGFYLGILEDKSYLENEFGKEFVSEMNKEIEEKCKPVLVQDYLAKEVGLKSFKQYKKHSNKRKLEKIINE